MVIIVMIVLAILKSPYFFRLHTW